MDKVEVLARILQAEGRGLTIVFCRTKRSCDQVSTTLTTKGFAAAAVHGDLGQGQRERAMRAFRSGKVDVLVATDVAARGLDVDDVTHVVNYECPEDEKAYLHRIGRTGRAGRDGVAVTFVDWADLTRWKMINELLHLDFEEPLETYSTSDAPVRGAEHSGRRQGRPAAITAGTRRARGRGSGGHRRDRQDALPRWKPQWHAGRSQPDASGTAGRDHGHGSDGARERQGRGRRVLAVARGAVSRLRVPQAGRRPPALPLAARCSQVTEGQPAAGGAAPAGSDGASSGPAGIAAPASAALAQPQWC